MPRDIDLLAICARFLHCRTSKTCNIINIVLSRSNQKSQSIDITYNMTNGSRFQVFRLDGSIVSSSLEYFFLFALNHCRNEWVTGEYRWWH